MYGLKETDCPTHSWTVGSCVLTVVCSFLTVVSFLSSFTVNLGTPLWSLSLTAESTVWLSTDLWSKETEAATSVIRWETKNPLLYFPQFYMSYTNGVNHLLLSTSSYVNSETLVGFPYLEGFWIEGLTGEEKIETQKSDWIPSPSLTCCLLLK